MDQQHQNFESFNDFSFVNAFSGTVENNPYAASATVINNQANSSSLYDLSNPQYVQYENNQPSVQEACSQDTVTFDPSQNNMMKALGVVRKDLSTLAGSSNNKKRKRIVVLNDDDSDEDANSNLKKEIFDNSNTNQNQDEQDKNDASESDVQTTDNEEEGENLTDIGALKAKFLLKNAVIIQGPDKKKKKSRLLDSDDENQMQTTSVDVDDIGVVNEDENNEEELFEENILITEAIAAPITASVESFQEENKIEESNSAPLTAAIEEEIQEKVVEEKEEIHSVANLESKIPPIPCEQNETPKISDETSKAQSNEETEIDPSMSVEAILENIKPMADDDEFFKFDKSSDENDKAIPNDEYFGTPDKQQQGQYKGKKRGPKPGSKRTPRDTSLSSTQQRKKRGDRYEE